MVDPGGKTRPKVEIRARRIITASLPSTRTVDPNQEELRGKRMDTSSRPVASNEMLLNRSPPTGTQSRSRSTRPDSLVHRREKYRSFNELPLLLVRSLRPNRPLLALLPVRPHPRVRNRLRTLVRKRLRPRQAIKTPSAQLLAPRQVAGKARTLRQVVVNDPNEGPNPCFQPL